MTRAAFNALHACALIGIVLMSIAGAAEKQEPGKAGGTMVTIGDGEFVVVLGTEPTPAVKRVAELLVERIKECTGVAPAPSGSKAKCRLVIGTVGSNEAVRAFAQTQKGAAPLGKDGYRVVVDAAQHEGYVLGQSDSGVVAGVGRLMREMRYEKGRLDIPALDISETPQMPNRGTYLWARKHYFNHPDRVDRYIEELALWGCNAILLWFEMGMFTSFEDTRKQKINVGFHNAHRNTLSPQEWLGLYKRFYKTARRMGMKTGLVMVANDAYMTSPKELRIAPIIGCPNWYLCPAKPGSVEKMVAWQAEVFKALAPLDIYNIFPADSGGCSCKACTPWPTRGFWKAAKALGDRIHEISPTTEIWIDTWHLNHPTFGGKDWQNLVNDLDGRAKNPDWFAGFEVGLAPHHRFARMSPEDREHYNKAKQPLTVFTEISMFRNHRGMLVKKKYWKSLQDELNDYDPKLMKGGWLYAERWNTDIAIILFNSWYWNPKKPVEAVLDEYASLYFGPEAETGRELLDLLDDGYRDPNRKQKIQKTVAKLAASVPDWVKRDWRWGEVVTSANRFK